MSVIFRKFLFYSFSTAKGVDHFKAGNNDTALKYFKHALQIDGENVEALVAQGAL